MAFGEDGEAPSIVPVASADLSGRVRWLESELMTLQRKVNDLQNELRKRLGADS